MLPNISWCYIQFKEALFNFSMNIFDSSCNLINSRIISTTNVHVLFTIYFSLLQKLCNKQEITKNRHDRNNKNVWRKINRIIIIIYENCVGTLTKIWFTSISNVKCFSSCCFKQLTFYTLYIVQNLIGSLLILNILLPQSIYFLYEEIVNYKWNMIFKYFIQSVRF